MTYYDRSHDKTTSDTYGLKCPYCQYIDTGAWEHFDDMDEHGYEVECGDCGKPFWASCLIEITYFQASCSMLITYYGAPAVQEKPE